jgi:hypothetical protein
MKSIIFWDVTLCSPVRSQVDIRISNYSQKTVSSEVYTLVDGVTIQKTVIYTVTVVRTSNLTQQNMSRSIQFKRLKTIRALIGDWF